MTGVNGDNARGAGLARGSVVSGLGPNGYPTDAKMANGTFLHEATPGSTPRASANASHPYDPQRYNGFSSPRHQSIYLDAYGNGGNRGRDSKAIGRVMSTYGGMAPILLPDGNGTTRSRLPGVSSAGVTRPSPAAMGGGQGPGYYRTGERGERTREPGRINTSNARQSDLRSEVVSPMSASSGSNTLYSPTIRSPISPLSAHSSYSNLRTKFSPYPKKPKPSETERNSTASRRTASSRVLSYYHIKSPSYNPPSLSVDGPLIPEAQDTLSLTREYESERRGRDGEGGGRRAGLGTV